MPTTIEDLYYTKNGTINLGRTAPEDIHFRPFPFKMHRYPTSFQACDNVIVNREAGKILLVMKPKETLWRFSGGFVDPADTSLEAAAVRERIEELSINLEVTSPTYVGSFRVADPRYEDKPDKIMSAIMLSFFIFGRPQASDDLKGGKVQWFTKDYIRRNYKTRVMPAHRPLVEKLIELNIL